MLQGITWKEIFLGHCMIVRVNKTWGYINTILGNAKIKERDSQDPKLDTSKLVEDWPQLWLEIH